MTTPYYASMTTTKEGQIIDLANAIANQAEAIATGTARNREAAARLIRSNADTLVAWLELRES